MFRAVVRDAEKTEDHLSWGSFRGYMKGKLAEFSVWEIGFKMGGKQYRFLGVFDGTKKAVFLCGCYHKDRVYAPASALNLAYKRAKNVARKAVRLEKTITDDL